MLSGLALSPEVAAVVDLVADERAALLVVDAGVVRALVADPLLAALAGGAGRAAARVRTVVGQSNTLQSSIQSPMNARRFSLLAFVMQFGITR